MIPKIAHFIWYQGWDKFPEKYHANVDSIFCKNPNWQIKQWDNNSIREELKSLGQVYLDKYDNFKILHQKIDYARYVLLYIYGGVSVDTDVVALKGFDSTPNIDTSDFIVSEKPHSKSINNATILSSKNNPILKHVIDNINTKPCLNYQSDFQCIQNTTGPYAFNKLLKDYRDQITVLDKSYFEPCASVDPYCVIPDNSVLDHRHELSWLKPEHKKVMRLYYEAKHYIGYILFFILLLILILILTRNKN